MADAPDGSSEGPNLELPSFGFRRKRKNRKEKRSDAAAAEETTAVEPVDEPAPELEPEPVPQPEPEPAPQPEPERQRDPEPAPVTAEEPAVHEPTLAAEEPAVHEPTLAAEERHPVAETSVLPTTAAPAPEEPAADEPATAPEEEPTEKRPFTLPRVHPVVAAVLTGVVSGLVGVGLAYVSTRGCEAVRGVGSCGAFGVVALLVVLAVEVLIGAILLRAWGVSDPASTSFLAVGLVAVLAMLFFLPSIDSVWMLVVIPGLSAASFVLSWWVTSNFVESPNTS